MTKKSRISQHKIDKVGKIGPFKTFFTLLKGFVATGVLFLPKGWRNGGWLFSTTALIASAVLTIIASLKLLEVRNKYKLSYSEIGRKAYGLPGKIAVDFYLTFTQTIFVCAYITFIVDSVNNILHETFDRPKINNWILGGVCFLIYVPLCWVRKIEKFAIFHVVADISIVIGLTVITIYASIELKDHGFSDDEELINPKTFLSFLGLAAYTFEGIGIIIPVMETTSRPDLYPMIVILVIVIITAVYIFFGNYCYFIYGSHKLGEHPLITSLLDAKQIPVVLVDLIWIVNLIFTYPLVLHPASMVIESYLFRDMPKSSKRTWLKNLCRTLLVGFTVCLAIYLMETLDKLESVNGTFACIPLAFLLPCLFHYKLVAETRAQKIVDLSIAALSLALQLVCTVITFLYWNE